MQPSKFGNQLKKLKFLIFFLKNGMILNKGQYYKLSDEILVYYIERAFSFPFIGAFRHLYIIVENLRFQKDKKYSRDERENVFSK